MENIDDFVNQTLMYYNRREPSKVGFLDFMILALTREFGLTRAAVYELDLAGENFVPIIVTGPDSPEDHDLILEKLAKMTDEEIFQEDRLSNIQARTSPSLDERFKAHLIPLNSDSRFRDCYVTGISYLGKKDGHKQTQIDRIIEEYVFKTNEYALITIKGRRGGAAAILGEEQSNEKEQVIAIIYADAKFRDMKLTGQDGEPIIKKEAIRRITEETSMYLQLIRAFEESKEIERLATIGAFAEYIADEIRSPLTIIGGFCKRIRKKPENSERYISTISKEVALAEDLLNQLEDSTKKELKPQLGKVNVYETLARALAREKYGYYRITKSDGEIYVLADPVHVERASRNLAECVLYAVENEKQLTVNVETYDSFALINFHNPKSMPQEIGKNIFNSLSEVNGKRAPGLRLAMAQKYMRANNGDLLVNTGLEKGTTFTLKLPLYKGQDII